VAAEAAQGAEAREDRGAPGGTPVLDEDRLVRWGREVGTRVEPPLFLGLRGELGAGKSVLARAIARGAGVEAVMPSPTFNLLFRYRGRGGLEVVHLDLFRLDDPDELWELGWEELGRDRELVLVEWPERAGELLPFPRWEIRLRIPEPGATPGADRASLRRVELRAHGAPAPLPPLPEEEG